MPETYHIYFADYLGTPGSVMTFFGWPTWPNRRAGSGQVTVVSFAVPHGALDFWSGRLRKLGVAAKTARRFDTDLIALEDHDGIQLELVGQADDERWVPWPDGPVDVEHAIRGFHSVTLTEAETGPTFDLMGKTMGFRKVAEDGKRSRFETGGGGPHSIVDVIESPDGPMGHESIGTVHHVAWRAGDDAHQKAWRDVLVGGGFSVTPVIDRYYFKSIYFREPGGVLFEIATDGPGFTVDEAPETLSTTLSLPPWFQVKREQLDVILPPIVVPTTATTGAGH